MSYPDPRYLGDTSRRHNGSPRLPISAWSETPALTRAVAQLVRSDVVEASGVGDPVELGAERVLG
ncbi:MAG: hypothetical protein ACRDRX_03855 [Pseudonocardiaceae bacterium]